MLILQCNLYTKQASLWIALRALAWKHDCELVKTMRRIRDEEARGSAAFRELCQTPSFGSATADTTMSSSALRLQSDYPDEHAFREHLDEHVFTRLLLLSARASAEHFRSTLTKILPGANIAEGHSKPSSHNPDALKTSFAPVKGVERTLVKWKEYSAESDLSHGPVAPQVRDTLRAKIEAPNGDAFANAAHAIMAAFDVREGNGRLKNNLLVEKHQPPNILMNIVLCPPGMPPITAEVQLYLQDIETINEHRYYKARFVPG